MKVFIHIFFFPGLKQSKQAAPDLLNARKMEFFTFFLCTAQARTRDNYVSVLNFNDTLGFFHFYKSEVEKILGADVEREYYCTTQGDFWVPTEPLRDQEQFHWVTEHCCSPTAESMPPWCLLTSTCVHGEPVIPVVSYTLWFPVCTEIR